jgi:hypothetical protein
MFRSDDIAAGSIIAALSEWFMARLVGRTSVTSFDGRAALTN